MSDSLRPESGLTSPRRWALLAGAYAFGCATLTAFLLSDLLGLFAEVIGLPAALSMPLLATPALVGGAGVWWALVERPGTVTYARGAAFGLVTALLTGALWTVRFALVWGPEMLTAGPVPLLVGFVLGAVSVAGVLVGLPLTFVRRWSRNRPEAAATANSL
ncbi:hypothetical protein [Halorubrum sp. Boch-26]|uniref:hypothetical protein n=1 Tax=Halorubrum sp. Boch-26 TaxID=2994426 RepID=UPI0024692AC5|nr:hypothetical protein [Halorubrum sp. Boch-26]